MFFLSAVIMVGRSVTQATSVSENAEVPEARAWRLRNAVSSNGNAWALRGLRFCPDLALLCDGDSAISGQPFDDGGSRSWSLPENAFDEDYSNFWKNFNGPRIGESYIGMVYNDTIGSSFPRVSIQSIGIRPDNIVYTVDEIYVEYWVGAWNATLDEITAYDPTNETNWETWYTLTDVAENNNDREDDGFWYRVLVATEPPSMAPSISASPTVSMSPSASVSPSVSPSASSSLSPSATPTVTPSMNPTSSKPTLRPTGALLQEGTENNEQEQDEGPTSSASRTANGHDHFFVAMMSLSLGLAMMMGAF